MEDRQQRQRRQLVQQWLDSGLSAERFGAQHGLSAGTLRVWKFRLSQLSPQCSSPPKTPRTQRRSLAAPAAPLPLVELHSTHLQAPHDGFVLELPNGRRLRVPASFEADSLRKLLCVLEQVP